MKHEPNPHHPRSTAAISGHPIHPMLIPLPITFFLTTLVTDLIFIGTGNMFWAEVSRWSLIAGLVTAVLAAITGLIDYSGDPRIRRIGKAHAHMIGNIIVVAIELINLGMRIGDNAAAGIEPLGVILSAAAAALLGITGWLGGELVFRHGVAVTDDKLHVPANDERP